MEFSFIIVTYHNENTIDDCLNSIYNQVKNNFEIIVVDNSENNLTLEKLKNHKVKVIKPEKNIGFAAGCNVGADNSTGKYLIFLNPDTVLLNDIASILKDFYNSKEKCAVVGPQFYNPKNNKIEITCKRLPNFFNMFIYAIGLDRFTNFYSLNYFSHDSVKKVDQVMGACFFVKKDIFEKLGKFDERFFIYFEEVDFCKRAIDNGYEIWFCPDAKVYHIEGVSCESEAKIEDMIIQLRKSRLLYFEKHYGKIGKIYINFLNRFEGLYRGIVFFLLFLLKKDNYLLKKSKAFFKLILHKF